MAITLYDLAGAEAGRRFSPFCWRTKMALAHKGLDVETVPWRFTEKDKLPQPNAGRVPVIVDDGRGRARSRRRSPITSKPIFRPTLAVRRRGPARLDPVRPELDRDRTAAGIDRVSSCSTSAATRRRRTKPISGNRARSGSA